MKRFLCADVVPGCDAVLRGGSVDDVICKVRDHLGEAHGMAATAIPGDDELTARVRSVGWLRAALGHA